MFTENKFWHTFDGSFGSMISVNFLEVVCIDLAVKIRIHVHFTGEFYSREDFAPSDGTRRRVASIEIV